VLALRLVVQFLPLSVSTAPSESSPLFSQALETVPMHFSTAHIEKWDKSLLDTNTPLPSPGASALDSWVENRKKVTATLPAQGALTVHGLPVREPEPDLETPTVQQTETDATPNADPLSPQPRLTSLSADEIRDENNRKRKAKRQSIKTLVAIRFQDAVPVEAPPYITGLTHLHRHRNRQMTREGMAALQAMFELRPMWLRKHLGRLPLFRLNPNLLKKLLPKFAYCFISGPHKANWVRYGYDPRLEPSSVLQQLLQIRFHRDSEVSALIMS
jgi:RNA polymerase III transcription factor (TF)IIIC subunit HTH domain